MNSYTCTHTKHIQNKHLSPHMCCCSVTKSCPTLCNPMDCNAPSFPILHYLLEVCSNSRPLSQWCYPAFSSFVTNFSFCPQSFLGCWSPVVSDSKRVRHELQHASLPCPSLSPGVCSNSRPLSQWCHSTISSSVIKIDLFQSCGHCWVFQTCSQHVVKWRRECKTTPLFLPWEPHV